MGGYRIGAGRPASHGKTTAALRIDVRHLQREGHLNGCYSFQWAWAAGGAQIALQTSPDSITAIYRYKSRQGVWHSVDQQIAITHTACHYGGQRPWFTCPECGGRVATIYLWSTPRCRKCADLKYPSQSLDAIGRSWRRSSKLEARLSGGKDGWNYRRPKGMHAATYDRLAAAYRDEEWLRDEMLEAHWSRLVAMS